jgi:biopolymer transport protein ExbD
MEVEMSSPNINVTPLIDVLLVLLIIFMVVAPLRPSSFQAKVPAEPDPSQPGNPHPDALVVSIDKDLSLSVNERKSLGKVDDSNQLTQYLTSIFERRLANGDLDESGKVRRVVFIRAPRNLGYGNVVKVIDAVKQAGAEPLALQIDYLD